MSTTAAFFVGEGENARFLGGHYSDGDIQEKEDPQRGGIPPSLLFSATESEFRYRVGLHMAKVRKEDKMVGRLSWSKAKGVQYIYCFFEDHVWVTNGGRWYNNYIPAIKPSKEVPSDPVCRVGKISIDVVVECGQCQLQEKLGHKDFNTQPNGWPVINLYSHVMSMGWQYTHTQGWLCADCKQ